MVCQKSSTAHECPKSLLTLHMKVPFDGQWLQHLALVGRMGGPGSLSLWLTLAILINGFGVVLAIMFFRFVLFLICYSVHFPCNLQHFGEGSCQFNNIATFWSSNLSFSMVFASIGAQTSHVQGYFATRIQLRYWLGLLEGCIQDVLNVGLV